jgi:hypothetical protein
MQDNLLRRSSDPGDKMMPMNPAKTLRSGFAAEQNTCLLSDDVVVDSKYMF